jgi:C4-dicarboxylate-specific signal transduction histidine kinase
MTGSLNFRRILGGLTIAVVMAAIFIADTVTDYAIAFAVFYCAVLLAATNLYSVRTVSWLSAACISLTILSFYLTNDGEYEIGLLNTAISLVAIGITSLLGIKIMAARTAAEVSQARLQQLSRITSLGEMAASIAHEVNQPLGAIIASSNACQRWLNFEPPNMEKARLAIERIIADANRASDVITRIRALTRGEAPQASLFDMNQAIVEVVQFSRNELDRHNISLKLSLAENLPKVFADRIQLQQVLGNLLNNAIESIRQNSRNPHREIEFTTQVDEQGALLVGITDSGKGFSNDALEHMFDAFWTEKETGVGLGLAISRTIMEANQGRIWASHRPEGGARFQFILPLNHSVASS